MWWRLLLVVECPDRAGPLDETLLPLVIHVLIHRHLLLAEVGGDASDLLVLVVRVLKAGTAEALVLIDLILI